MKKNIEIGKFLRLSINLVFLGGGLALFYLVAGFLLIRIGVSGGLKEAEILRNVNSFLFWSSGLILIIGWKFKKKIFYWPIVGGRLKQIFQFAPNLAYLANLKFLSLAAFWMSFGSSRLDNFLNSLTHAIEENHYGLRNPPVDTLLVFGVFLGFTGYFMVFFIGPRTKFLAYLSLTFFLASFFLLSSLYIFQQGPITQILSWISTLAIGAVIFSPFIKRET